MSSSVLSRRTIRLPPLLAAIIRAVAKDSRRDGSGAAGNRALALNDLARLFTTVVPLRGLDPADDLRDEIERVANRYLRRSEAEAEFRRAVDCIESIDQRDAIESAHGQVIESSELAHYYAGIAAGITLADLSRRPG